ncbi:MAG: type II secretion system protein GspG [Planctomycetota bacterium]
MVALVFVFAGVLLWKMWWPYRPGLYRATENQVSVLESTLRVWLVAEGQFPSPDFEETVRVLLLDKRGIGDRLRERCPQILRNRDSWGNPFFYEINGEGRTAVIRSFGPNGEDDGGGGDDIHGEVVNDYDGS